MAEQTFLYGIYGIYVRPVELEGSRWDAEYEIRQGDKPVKRWTTIGGVLGYAHAAAAISAAHEQAVVDIQHGAGLPKPKTFP